MTWAIKAEHPKLGARYWLTDHAHEPFGRWVSDRAQADKFDTHRHADERLVEVPLPDTSGEWFLKAESSSDGPDLLEPDAAKED